MHDAGWVCAADKTCSPAQAAAVERVHCRRGAAPRLTDVGSSGILL